MKGSNHKTLREWKG
ncbi:hypothetical protein ACDZ94_24565 (plasmid) [Pseudomonas sp. UBT]